MFFMGNGITPYFLEHTCNTYFLTGPKNGNLYATENIGLRAGPTVSRGGVLFLQTGGTQRFGHVFCLIHPERARRSAGRFKDGGVPAEDAA
jgi:hypothetical protein